MLLSAMEKVRPLVRRTPVLTSRSVDRLAGARLFFKCENFQTTGSFKLRGASHALACLLEQGPVAGVATHSSGNFAAAVACAAGRAGLPAAIVMPQSASEVKKLAVRGYGARIVECAPTLAAREAALALLVEQSGYATLHPYDHPWTIAGQATCAMDFLEEVPDADFLVAPVGGGGLVAGTALAARFFGKRTRVAAGEPAAADDAYRSLQSGHLVPQTDPHTMADGLLTSLGRHTFPLLRDFVERILLVSEQEIVEAMRVLFTRMKIVVEPSSAVAVAAVLAAPQLFGGTCTGIILSGGNVDPDRLPFGYGRS
jgi:threonine dehydratase